MYVANREGNNVSAYAINLITGVLTPVSGSPFTTGVGPDSVTVDPAGKFAYVANFDATANSISAFTINASTGALTAVSGSPFNQSLAQPTSVMVDPADKFVYAANGFGLSVFTINSASGALTALSGSPFNFTPNASPASVVISGTIQ